MRRKLAGLMARETCTVTTWLNEELVGRTDEEGNILKGTNWLNEEKVGRVDEDGKVYKGTNWLNEEQTGRVGE